MKSGKDVGRWQSKRHGHEAQKFFGSFFQKRTALPSPENPQALGYQL
jgi:hypothetical protein